MIDKIIKEVESIHEKYRKEIEKKESQFNVFSILRKEHDEELLHSAFLVELLNPQGSHKQGAKYLKHFVSKCVSFEFDTKSIVEIRKEKGTTDGGRLDIFIMNSVGQAIAIENKIYAADQPNQLIRYYNFLSENRDIKSFELIYLTLDGKLPSEVSVKLDSQELYLNEHFEVLSYRKEILNWLSECIGSSDNAQEVSIAIKQYVSIVQRLTGKIVFKEMEDEIIRSIRSNYSEAKLIIDNFDKAKEVEIELFLNALKGKLVNELADGREVEVEDIKNNYSGLVVRHKDWDENLGIKLQGEGKMAQHRSILGLFGHKEHINRNKIKSKLEGLSLWDSGYKESIHWVCFKEVFNFGDSRFCDKLFDENQRDILLEVVFEQISFLVKSCGDKLRDDFSI